MRRLSRDKNCPYAWYYIERMLSPPQNEFAQLHPPACALILYKFYCLLSDEDIGESFSIERNKFSQEQELVAQNIEHKYPKLKFIFLANQIFDKNVPSNFSKIVGENSYDDYSIDEIDGLRYPNSDDLDLSDD